MHAASVHKLNTRALLRQVEFSQKLFALIASKRFVWYLGSQMGVCDGSRHMLHGLLPNMVGVLHI